MIELKIKEYCHCCPNFEAKVDKIYANGRAYITTVSCEYADRCENIEYYITKRIEDDEQRKVN